MNAVTDSYFNIIQRRLRSRPTKNVHYCTVQDAHTESGTPKAQKAACPPQIFPWQSLVIRWLIMANRLQFARCNLPHHLKTFVREQIAGRPAKFWKEIGPRFSPSCLKETTYSDHPHPINSERLPKVEPLQRFHPTAPSPAIHGHPASAPPCHWEAPALNWQGHFLVFKFGPPSWGHVSQHSREFLPILFGKITLTITILF